MNIFTQQRNRLCFCNFINIRYPNKCLRRVEGKRAVLAHKLPRNEDVGLRVCGGKAPHFINRGGDLTISCSRLFASEKGPKATIG
jgi:hypothetical protein